MPSAGLAFETDRHGRPGTAAPEAPTTEMNGTAAVAAAEDGADQVPEGMSASSRPLVP